MIVIEDLCLDHQLLILQFLDLTLLYLIPKDQFLKKYTKQFFKTSLLNEDHVEDLKQDLKPIVFLV